MMVRWSGEVQVNVSAMQCQVNVKSKSELDIGGRETCPCRCDFHGGVVGQVITLLEFIAELFMICAKCLQFTCQNKD